MYLVSMQKVKKKLIPNDFIQNDKIAKTTPNSFFKSVNL